MFSLGWLPIIGPIIDGVVTIFSKAKDTDLAKYKIDGQLNVDAWKAANELTISFRDNISVRLARDIVMFPGSLWCGMYIWGRTWDIYWPQLVIPVKALEGPMEYLPYALMTFFFGMAAIKRR